MAVLVTATVLEKIYGTDFAAAHIYGAGWFAALWGALTLAALACLFRRKLWRRPAVLLLHLSFAVILAGASRDMALRPAGDVAPAHGRSWATAFAGRDGSSKYCPSGPGWTISASSIMPAPVRRWISSAFSP